MRPSDTGNQSALRSFFSCHNKGHCIDRAAFLSLLLIGGIAVALSEGRGLRPHLALAGAIVSLIFVLVYSTRPWRKTYAGRAAMLSMCVTVFYTGNAALILWWPRYDYGYPHWENVTELVYLCILLAALYKLRALVRQPGQSGTPNKNGTDPTV